MQYKGASKRRSWSLGLLRTCCWPRQLDEWARRGQGKGSNALGCRGRAEAHSLSPSFAVAASDRPLRDHIAAPPVATLGKLGFVAAAGADQATAAKPQASKAALVSRFPAAG